MEEGQKGMPRTAGQMYGRERGRKKGKRERTKEGKKKDRGSVVGKEEARE